MLNKSRRMITIMLMIGFALTGGALAQGMGGGGHGGHGGGHGDGDGDGWGGGGGCGQDSLVMVDLAGTVMIDSVIMGFQMDSTGGCGNWDSSFVWGPGSHGQGGHHGSFGQMNHANQDHEWMNPLLERDGDSLRAVYSLDIDNDGVADYVLNFGPDWYQPEDSTLTRPAAGDEITVSGRLMEDSPMWESDVVVVFTLNGGTWREQGGMGGGGMMPRRIAKQTPRIGRYTSSPNPFNPTTIISVELLANANLNVTIYDLKGREIKNLVNQNYAPGTYQFMWNGTSQSGLAVPSGVYIYTVQSGNNISSSQITLLK